MSWMVNYEGALPFEGRCVVVIGNFDGVHAGHRSLLTVAKAEAQARGLPLVALTFEPHPRAVLRPDVPLKRLSTLDEKAGLLAVNGVDGVAVLDFTREVAGWSAQAFVDDVLVGWLRAGVVCVGENFRFGHKASGDVNLLKAQTKFTTTAVPLLMDEAGVVSSSRLREEA